MTWVIGGITPFGYGVGISDIRVSWNTGYFKDCLQKVYPVGNFIIAGFAGSVDLGFKLIDDLRQFLFLDEPNEAWIPEWVAIKWYRRARRIFNRAPKHIQKLGSSILLVGIHPNKNEGESPWPKGTACLFNSPDFEVSFSKSGEFISIGSGSNVAEYVKMLKASTKNFENAGMQAEVAMKGGFGHNIKINITESLLAHDTQSVSTHLHIFIAERGRLFIGANNHLRSNGSNGYIEFKMPTVATSYNEFLALCKNENINAVSAVC